jgi:hypothetical protein
MSPEAQRIAIAEACRVTLTQGFSAWVDAADLPLVAPFKWRVKRNGRTNYAISDTGGRRVWMHKIVLGTAARVDHRDNDGLNNRRYNLREISNTDNIRRKRPNEVGSSPFKGVSRNRRMRKWQATIKVNGQSLWLGAYDNETAAARAYDAAAKKHFGEHAFINFP